MNPGTGGLSVCYTKYCPRDSVHRRYESLYFRFPVGKSVSWYLGVILRPVVASLLEETNRYDTCTTVSTVCRNDHSITTGTEVSLSYYLWGVNHEKTRGGIREEGNRLKLTIRSDIIWYWELILSKVTQDTQKYRLIVWTSVRTLGALNVDPSLHSHQNTWHERLNCQLITEWKSTYVIKEHHS